MTARLSRYLVPLTLALWGGVFVYFYSSGRLQSFLHPSLRPLVLATGLGLMFTGILVAVCDEPAVASGLSAEGPRNGSALCLDGCGRVHFAPTAGGWLKLLVLILPILVAVVISPDGFGAALVRNRSVSQPPAAAPAPATRHATAPSVLSATPPSAPVAANNGDKSQYLTTDALGHVKAELVDFQYAAQSPDLRKDFDHKILEVTGQFLPTPGADRQHFILTRLFLICCAADAQPINVAVETNSSALVPANLPEMAWVRVTGAVRFEHTDQIVATPIITAAKIESIPVPKEKYLY